MRNLTDFEHKSEPVIAPATFMARLGRALVIWLGITLGGLAIGIAGYAYFEGMSLTDAFVNAAMILSGMGPVGELKTEGGKILRVYLVGIAV